MRDALAHTLLFIALYLPTVLALGLGLALLLNRPLRGLLSLIRTAFFMPVVSSWVAVSLMWKWLLNPAFGLVNYLLGLAHLPQPGWWADPHWALPAVIIASVWKDLGFVMVLLLAGLQNIGRQYYEAAMIDGADAWARFRHVTLAAPLAGHLLRRRHLANQFLSGLRPGLGHDQRRTRRGQFRPRRGDRAQRLQLRAHGLRFRALLAPLRHHLRHHGPVQLLAQRKWVTYD